MGSIKSLADFIGVTCDVPFYLLGLWCFCKEKPKSFAVLELVSRGALQYSLSIQTPEHPLLPPPTTQSHLFTHISQSPRNAAPRSQNPAGSVSRARDPRTSLTLGSPSRLWHLFKNLKSNRSGYIHNKENKRRNSC